MFATRERTPGLYFESVRATDEVDSLRTDIAGFVGPTERGPVGRLERVTGWRAYVELFGAETETAVTPFSIRGYFENGGEVAYIVRSLGNAASIAAASWIVGDLDPVTDEWLPKAPAAGGFTASRYRISASSPGIWAQDLRVTIDYQLNGRGGAPQLAIKVIPKRGQPEFLPAISPASVEQEVARFSNLIRITPIPGNVPMPAAHAGPARIHWGPISLQGGTDAPANLVGYQTDSELLLSASEVSLLAIPDMYQLGDSDAYGLLAHVAAQADVLLDRQVIATPPEESLDINPSVQWVQLRQDQLAARSARSVSVYQPWLEVHNPLGGVNEPLRRVPPVGHVAGVISRLDRERGAHHTPANAMIVDAVDSSHAYDVFGLGVLVDNGINPLRCRHGRGLQVWGGRTLAIKESDPEGLFIAHRRLIHRLVRAIRRVADPLVFNNNGTALWLVLVRAITTVLLRAYRAGALKGERPEEAFRVTCDETNNPPTLQDLGQVHCDIQLAPAIPMEFITLRIAVSSEGRLEMITP